MGFAFFMSSLVEHLLCVVVGLAFVHATRGITLAVVAVVVLGQV